MDPGFAILPDLSLPEQLWVSRSSMLMPKWPQPYLFCHEELQFQTTGLNKPLLSQIACCQVVSYGNKNNGPGEMSHKLRSLTHSCQDQDLVHSTYMVAYPIHKYNSRDLACSLVFQSMKHSCDVIYIYAFRQILIHLK